MKRPKFPKTPANIRIPRHNMLFLARWGRQAMKEGLNPYASTPTLTIQPNGYWGDTITIRDHRRNRNDPASFYITYSSGGTDGTLTNRETIENFTTGLKHAQVLADWLAEYTEWVHTNAPKQQKIA